MSITQTSGFHILNKSLIQKFYNQDYNKTWDHNTKLSEAQVQKADVILKELALSIKDKWYTWEQLAMKVEVDICNRIMKLTLKTVLNFHKCLIFVKSWLEEKLCQ